MPDGTVIREIRAIIWEYTLIREIRTIREMLPFAGPEKPWNSSTESMLDRVHLCADMLKVDDAVRAIMVRRATASWRSRSAAS